MRNEGYVSWACNICGEHPPAVGTEREAAEALHAHYRSPQHAKGYEDYLEQRLADANRALDNYRLAKPF